MGRYEDLLAQAKEEGTDSEAWDALQNEFGVSTLRDKANEADAFKDKYTKVLPVARKARLDELIGKLDEDLREAGLGVEDFGDFDPDDLSLEQVQDKAKSKRESTQVQKLAIAKDAGFETVEEYTEALEAAKTQKTQRREGMESVAGGVSSSGGEPAGTDEPTLLETGKAAFDKSKTDNESDDVALARTVDAILSAQAPTEE